MIIDTNRRTNRALGCLRENGVNTIIRYYARTTGQPEKRLTRAEAEAIIAAGASIAVVHQAGGASVDSFSAAQGRQDAAYAFRYAIETIGQPAGSSIYFAVDFDCDARQFKDRIVPHLRGIQEVNESGTFTKKFSIGAYGNGLVLDGLLTEHLCQRTWLSQSTGHHESKAFKATNKWTLFQQLPSMLCGIGVDIDDVQGNAHDIGQFDDLDTVRPALAVGGIATSVGNRFRVNATSGLRLRGGPGTDFDVQRLLAVGTIVEVLSRVGEWAIVDINGNGVADGAVHAAFLESVD